MLSDSRSRSGSLRRAIFLSSGLPLLRDSALRYLCGSTFRSRCAPHRLHTGANSRNSRDRLMPAVTPAEVSLFSKALETHIVGRMVDHPGMELIESTIDREV